MPTRRTVMNATHERRLTISCDGSHYMPWDAFLERDIGFWVGKAAAAPACSALEGHDASAMGDDRYHAPEAAMGSD